MYAITPNTLTEIANNPEASPSRPSVKLTALDVAETTKMIKIA